MPCHAAHIHTHLAAHVLCRARHNAWKDVKPISLPSGPVSPEKRFIVNIVVYRHLYVAWMGALWGAFQSDHIFIYLFIYLFICVGIKAES